MSSPAHHRPCNSTGQYLGRSNNLALAVGVNSNILWTGKNFGLSGQWNSQNGRKTASYSHNTAAALGCSGGIAGERAAVGIGNSDLCSGAPGTRNHISGNTERGGCSSVGQTVARSTISGHSAAGNSYLGTADVAGRPFSGWDCLAAVGSSNLGCAVVGAVGSHSLAR